MCCAFAGAAGSSARTRSRHTAPLSPISPSRPGRRRGERRHQTPVCAGTALAAGDARLQKVQNPTVTACAAAPRSLQTLARAGSLRAASGRFLKTLGQHLFLTGTSSLPPLLCSMGLQTRGACEGVLCSSALHARRAAPAERQAPGGGMCSHGHGQGRLGDRGRSLGKTRAQNPHVMSGLVWNLYSILTPAPILQYFTQYSAPSAPILKP